MTRKNCIAIDYWGAVFTLFAAADLVICPGLVLSAARARLDAAKLERPADNQH